MDTVYDAVLVLSFGGPDGPDDVLPFIGNVVRGRNVPKERIRDVAEHYRHFGGVSPLNEQNRVLIHALINELNAHGPNLPVYWGNRNWHPLLADTVRQMARDGVRRALAFVTSPYGSYSSCRQYLEDIDRARAEVGVDAPEIHKLRGYYNHPGFVEPMIERVRSVLDSVRAESDRAALVFTAHSIPIAMADRCRYGQQVEQACRLISEGVGRSDGRLAYQSRSGPPSQPWLEPDVDTVLCDLAKRGDVDRVVLAPVGFISDHMEVVYDLDVETRALCHQLGLSMHRSSTVGTHPRFVRMIRELIVERMDENAERQALGQYGPEPDECPADCCRAVRPN